MMYDELVKNLRKMQSHEYCVLVSIDGFPAMQIIKQAADAIEELMQAVDKGIKTGVELARMHGSDATSEELEKAFFQGCELGYKRAKEKQWIPVTERLPNCNGCYLVWRPHFFGGEVGMPSICYFDGSNTWHDSYGVDFERILHPEDITHWMPLPEPPKEET